MSASTRLIIAILVVAAGAIGFWMLLLGPKREEASKLSGELDALSLTLVQAQSAVSEAETAREKFPADYRQLVVLGEAVPEGDETASLLVELNRIADESKVKFASMQLNSSSEGGAVEVPTTEPPPEATTEPSGAVPASASVAPTEAAASLLPLGATIGPAGLAVMPYSLTFRGNFFEIADFIHQIDSLVDPAAEKVGVDGRLITIDGFALAGGGTETSASTDLDASFVVTTYLTPPGQGVTAGATPTEPSAATPTSAPAEEEATPSSETVSAR